MPPLRRRSAQRRPTQRTASPSHASAHRHVEEQAAPESPVAQLHHTLGNRVVSRLLRSPAAAGGVIQRALSNDQLVGAIVIKPIDRLTRENFVQTIMQRLRDMKLRPDEQDAQTLETWMPALVDYNSLNATQRRNLPAPVKEIREIFGQMEEREQVESVEQRAARITSTDNNGRAIGPFDGGRGSKSEVPPSQGPVYYNRERTYCISEDFAGHAGDAWKLFILTSRGWQRLDTLHPDGRRMNRG